MINSQNFKMDRRIFLKSSSVALAAVTLESKRLAGLAPLTSMPAAGRLTLPMNRNWRFSAARLASDTARDFDDSHFDLITIPHTNKRLPWHSFDEKTYQFVSVYRRHFKLPPAERASEWYRTPSSSEGMLSSIQNAQDGDRS